ncbi:CoA-binding protein, partial [bacterium]|nr:CoA-binding protein [bacterium]MBU1024787.1 CoA-binding protein [bacterium]
MLEFLLYPERIAVIGASSSLTKVGQAVISNILRCGFEGDVVLINPDADSSNDLECYKSLKDYKGNIDLAVVDVPAELTKKAVQDCIRASAKSVCVLTTGFKEIGPEGEKLEQEIVNMCRSSNVRLLGPNVVGIINTHHKLNTTYGTQMPLEGGISLISQSGAICTVLLEWAHGRKIGLASLISIGNKGDLNEVDFLDALSDDENTKVIICYLSDIQNGDAFIKAAKTAALKKPVVVLKAGVTDAGAKAAHPHTGSMAGTDIAYGAAFSRSGIIRANSIAQLLDFGIAFEMQPLPVGDNVAVITNGGGLGTAAADAIIDSGLNVNPFSDRTVNLLRTKLPNVSAIWNPVNIRMSAQSEFYLDALNIIQDDPEINAILCLCAPQAVTPPEVIADIIINNARGDKPILAVFMGDHTMRE